MNNKLEFDCLIYDDYKNLLKKNIYEPIILKLMNESEIIFQEKYQYIENQSHNESDFTSESGIFYDAKILYYERQCQSLAINKDNLYTFLIGLQKEINEVYESITNKDYEILENSTFYKEMLARIKKANEHENIILFIPFPCTQEISTDLSSLLKTDIFTYIFDYIKEKESKLIEGHNIYIVYPNIENYIIIKRLNDNTLEFILDDSLSKYIKFEIK